MQVTGLFIYIFKYHFYPLFDVVVKLLQFLVGLEKCLIQEMHYKYYLKASLVIVYIVLQYNQVFHQFLPMIF